MYLNAFDDSSLKPQSENKTKVGFGWLGRLGIVMIAGKNLFQTILLNFVLYNEDVTMKDGLAVWEEDNVRIDERITIPLPDNFPAFLTMQNRRIQLIREKDRVTGYVILGGDVVQTDNALIEQMTTWQCDNNIWIPKPHSPDKMIWRDYSSLLVRSEANSEEREPGVVSWVSTLIDYGLIDSKTIEIRTLGVVYGKNGSSIDNLIFDSISINSKMLLKLNIGWNIRIDREINKTEKCVNHLARLGYKLATYSCNDKNIIANSSKMAREKGYSILDVPFRQWLSTVNPAEQDMESKLSEWDSILKKTLLDEGKSMVARSSTRALIGKTDKKIENAFTAFRLFKNNITKVTGSQNDE